MTEVPMTWSARNRELVLANIKLATTRRTRHGVVGDHFILDGRRFTFMRVRPMRLGHVAHFYYALECHPSSEAFLKHWVECYGLLRPPVLDDIVFLHEFSEVVTASPSG